MALDQSIDRTYKHGVCVNVLQVFLSAGANITVELTDVSLVSPLLASPPRLLPESQAAVVTVPEEAASSEVNLLSLPTRRWVDTSEYGAISHLRSVSVDIESHSM